MSTITSPTPRPKPCSKPAVAIDRRAALVEHRERGRQAACKGKVRRLIRQTGRRVEGQCRSRRDPRSMIDVLELFLASSDEGGERLLDGGIERRLLIDLESFLPNLSCAMGGIEPTPPLPVLV